MTARPLLTGDNVIAGPARIYYGAFGATEPTDANVASAPASAVWTTGGFTEGGIKVVSGYTFGEYHVDQVLLPVSARAQKQEFTVTTNLAEATIENLNNAWSGLGTISTGSGFKALDPPNMDGGTVPTFLAMILDGYAVTDSTQSTRRMRLIVRKCLNIEPVSFAFEKDKQRVFSVKISALWVSDAIKPFHIATETA